MRFVPLDTFTITTQKTRAAVFKILHTQITSDTSYRTRNMVNQTAKPYIGRIANNSVRFSPKTRQSHGSTLVIDAQIMQKDDTISLNCRIFWHTVDYLINGVILLYFAAMAVLSIRHMVRMGMVRFVDLLPLSLLAFAYFLLMVVFTRGANYRKNQLTALFASDDNAADQHDTQIFE